MRPSVTRRMLFAIGAYLAAHAPPRLRHEWQGGIASDPLGPPRPPPFAPPPTEATAFGMGGGGALFEPAISPHDRHVFFVQCDMGGLYRTTDGGLSFALVEGAEFTSLVCDTCPPAAFRFDPRDDRTIYAFGRHGEEETLLVSHDLGRHWAVFAPAASWHGALVTSLAFRRDDQTLGAIGTDDGAFLVTYPSGRLNLERIAGAPPHVIGLRFTGGEPGQLVIVGEKGVRIVMTSRGATAPSVAGEGLPSRPLRHFSAGSSGTEDVLYVTVTSAVQDGRYEGGVYASRDNGRTWAMAMGPNVNQSTSRQDPYAMDEIAQYAFVATAGTQPQTVYVTSRGTGLSPPFDFNVWKSENAGARWREVLFGNPALRATDGIAPNVDVGWLTREYDWSWGGDALGFSVLESDPAMAVYTNLGELFVTEDGGQHWEQRYTSSLDVPSPERGGRWRSRGIDVTSSFHYYVDPFEPRVRYLAHADIGLSRSEDAGMSWRHTVSGSPWTNSYYQLAFDPAVPGRIWAAASRQHDIPHWTQLEGPQKRATDRGGEAGGIVFTDDRGDSWAVRSRGLPDGPAVAIALDRKSPVDARTLYAGIFGYGVYRSDDGGRGWRNLGAWPGENRHVVDVVVHAKGPVFVLVTGARKGRALDRTSAVYRSDDRGEHFRSVTSGLSFGWIAGFTADPADPSHFYLAVADVPEGAGARDRGREGGIYETTDSGATLRKLPFPRTDGRPLEVMAISLHPRARRTLFAGTNGHGTWASQDAGASWEQMPIPFKSTHRVEFAATEPNVAYVTTFGGGAYRVRYSDDGSTDGSKDGRDVESNRARDADGGPPSGLRR